MIYVPNGPLYSYSCSLKSLVGVVPTYKHSELGQNEKTQTTITSLYVVVVVLSNESGHSNKVNLHHTKCGHK